MKKLLCLLLILILPLASLADQAWILCQPESYVVCHLDPSKGSTEVGYFYCGDEIDTTGKTRNGYVQVDVPFEVGKGWVYKGYIDYDQPQEINEKRVITHDKVHARRYIDGPHRRWLNTGDTITVYWESDSWAATSQGYIKSEFTGDYDP